MTTRFLHPIYTFLSRSFDIPLQPCLCLTNSVFLVFWKATDRKKWSDINRLVVKAMGDLQSYSLTSWKVQSTVNTSQISGTIVVLVYDTHYEKGEGTETLTIHKPLAGGKFAILGHHFDSETIRQLIEKGIEQAADSGDT